MSKRWLKLFESMRTGVSMEFTSDVAYLRISSSKDEFRPVYYSSSDDDDLYLAIADQISRANKLTDKEPT